MPNHFLVTGTIILLAAAAPISARSLPAPPTAAERQAVAAALQTIRPDNPETAIEAETILVNMGPHVVPALEDALTRAEGPARDALLESILRLNWNSNPREKVLQWVAEATHMNAADIRDRQRPQPIHDDTVARILPELRFYTVHYRMYPLARVTPPPMKEQNLFAINRAGKVTHITDPTGLQTIFAGTIRTDIAPNAARLKDVTYAWLRLTEEFSWDGFFQFTIPRERLVDAHDGNGWLITGEVDVVPKGGDRGKIVAELHFTRSGRLSDIHETRMVQAGARPICQATKLLDSDPVVRGMAEQALLVMGVSARDYLAERRAIAAPELKRAIDAIWRRILDRERALGAHTARTDLNVGP